ncbi:MAG: kelch repeat-containing protein [Gemmatimonadota bacterium]|nr:kelch repeat-containing protein [Gemmatimonadota bacterium]
MRSLLEKTMRLALPAVVILLACGEGPADAKDRSGEPASEPAVVPAAEMATARATHTATLLPSGEVLITGGCRQGCETWSAATEIYDPETNTFREGPEMSDVRAAHAATLLKGGRVLVSGGWSYEEPGSETATVASAEIYDPEANAFVETGSMEAARSAHRMVTLSDGRVLAIGHRTVEAYDPEKGTFETAGELTTERSSHATVLLPDDRVLVTGGESEGGGVQASAEIFDPATGTSTPTGSMAVPRYKHGAATLADGRVLVVGGSGRGPSAWTDQHTSAEVWDPATGRFESVADMAETRFKIRDAVVALPDGSAAIAGGGERVEIYDPESESFRSAAGEVGSPRMFATATLLDSGDVLLVGGYDEGIDSTARAWLLRR